MIDINKFLAGYIACALWSTTDYKDEDGNEAYSLNEEFDSVSKACHAAMLSDCEDFIKSNSQDLHHLKAVAPECDDWRLGMLFWLNRAGHGSGFWDETNNPVGDKLSDASKPYGEFPLYGDFEMGVVRSHHYG